MAENGVKFLGSWYSPFSMKVQMALNLKSVDYDYIEEDLSNKNQRLVEANPVHKKIPVLIHDGKSICESLVIVQYIDEVWTTNCPSILPSDPYDRAIARFWAAYIDDKLFPSIRALFLGDAKDAVALEEVNHGLAVLENAFTNCSKAQKFFGGDNIGYVDIALGSILGWIKMSEKMGNLNLIGGPNTPNLFNWAQNFCGVDAVKDVMPEADKLLELAKAYAARVNEKK